MEAPPVDYFAVARDFLGAIHILCGGYVTLEGIFTLARMIQRGITQAGQ